ncbi:MAG: sugar phosphate isomerase/epimerase [Verrucomicrobia bacterium]|nr:sugar phosphate isomerase/epimerase [Verrucomicrobiota bacterium]
MMKTIVSVLHFDWSDIAGCFARACGDLKLDSVELSLHDGFSRPHCTRTDIASIRAAKRKYNAVVLAHIWENLPELGRSRGPEQLLQWLRIAEETGIEGLVVHGGTHPDRQQGIAVTQEILGDVVGRFERANVALLLENHYPYAHENCQELFSEPWEFLDLFKSVASPCLQFCFDTGHANMSRNAEALLRELAPYLRHVHLADNRGEHDDHLPFRRGTVPWDRIWSTLKEIAFDGTFCVEFPVREDAQPFRQCCEELRAEFRK